MSTLEDAKYSSENLYHVLRGPQLDEETVCRGYEDYLEYYSGLRKRGKGTRYLYTRYFRRGGICIYHYYLREVVEHADCI